MDFSALLKPILQNQVVTGLSFTAILGAAAYQLRSIPHLVRQGSLRFFTVELTVLSSDPSFEWVDRWLALQPYAKKAKTVMLRTNAVETGEIAVAASATDEREPLAWNLSPGSGSHVFWWRKRPIFLGRRFLTKDGENTRSKPIEELHFRTFGRSQKIMRRLIEDVRALSTKTDLVSIRIWSDYYWNVVRGKSIRPLNSIILRQGQIDRIIGDLEWFLRSASWYRERGIPYRRGYLFSGPPGTGKTSIVLAIAGHMNRPICVLNMGSVESDDGLFAAINQAPPNAIVLIEDIDCAFSSQSRKANPEDKADEAESKVTKAGLLNALDGITTPDGRIFIMTTNYPERLDPALVRPGRADVHEEFLYLDAPEQKRMAARFYADFEPLPFALSPAAMQAAFMRHPTDAVAARLLLSETRQNILDAALAK